MGWKKYDENGKLLTTNGAISLLPVSAMGVSNLGNTAGNTGSRTSPMQVLAGTGAADAGRIKMSQSTVTGSAPNTVHIVGIQPKMRMIHNSAAMYSLSSSAIVNGSLSLAHFQVNEFMTFTKIAIPVSISLANAGNANTAAMNMTAHAVIYSASSNTFLSSTYLVPMVGQSSAETFTWASSTGVYSSLTGPRLLTFNVETGLHPDNYFLGVQLSTTTGSSVGTATTALGATISMLFGSTYTAVPWAQMSQLTGATSTNHPKELQGMVSIPLFGTGEAIPVSYITKTGATALRANFIAVFENIDV